MTEQTRGVPLGSWLADLADDRLIRLLELRPDLAQPPPGSVAALAARAQARQSVRAATDELDFLRLAVIDALLVLHADAAPVPVTKLLALIGERAPEAEVIAGLADLTDRALCWGEGIVRVAAEAAVGLPWHPGQVTLENNSRTPEQIATAIDDLDESQSDLLEKLVTGSPMGRTRDAAPGAPPDRPVPRLLAAGLLRQVDDETVILPRLVGQVLRGEVPGPLQLTAPDPVISQTTAANVDAVAAGAVIDLLRELGVVLEVLGSTPVPELRSGGLGVREVKRLAKMTGVDEPRLGLLLEVATAAGLIATGDPDPEPLGDRHQEGPYWAPTVAADRFTKKTAAERWQLLASTWLDLPVRPGLIGSRGPDGKPRAALSSSLFSTAAPLDRRLLLTVLVDLPVGAGVDSTTASAALVWRRPRWANRLQPEPVADLLTEAHALGLMGRGAISSPARVLLSEGTGAAADAMTGVLPAPIDHFLVQADLTVVAPGPLERELAEELGTVATVESAGAAMVYRVSEQTIRRALDVGRTGAALQAFFEKHSKTPVPQGLIYLIHDVARRHGQLRIGTAMSFVRCEDPALLAQAVAVPSAEQLGLRVLAPTVAVSQAPIADVLAALRDAGFAPAAEDSTGTIVDIRGRGARVPTPAHRRVYHPVTGPSRESLTALVRVLRTATSAPFDNIRLDPLTAMIVLKRAALERAAVLIGYVDTAGLATQREVFPVAVRGGQLAAFDSTSGQMRDFAIHRITSVVSADD
ncbi:MAG TPA: helicase-associated domain-containing protein [Mycobacterium sp.]|nr:helicase-associated domain-containing protein [Mycobacterium sp.]